MNPNHTKFTQQGEQVDQQIKRYLDTVIAVVLEEVPQVKSILLGGGFGRGEGSVEIRNGKAIPQNDFELFLITEKPLPEKFINQVANKAAIKLDFGPVGADFYHFEREHFANTFYIDMKVLPIKKLSELLPMFRYYELKNASYLLHGKDYRHLMPDSKISNLPLSEGLRLLLNRMALLCLYFSFDYLEGMSFSEKHGLLYLGSKAWTDLGGALTQLNQTYQPTYQERLQAIKVTFRKDFPELSSKFPEIPDVIAKGTSFKLHPDFSGEIDPYKTWCEQKKYIREVTLYFCKRFFGKRFGDIFELADFLYEEGHRYYYHPYLNYTAKKKLGIKIKTHRLVFLLIPILNLFYFLRILKHKRIFYPRILFNKRAPDLTMFAAMLYILYGVTGRKEIDPQKLEKAKFYLKKTYPTDLLFEQSAAVSRTSQLLSQDIERVARRVRGLEMGFRGTIEQWEALKDDFSNAFLLFSLLKIV